MLLRMSTLFLRTLREDPADAEVPSHKLLVRAEVAPVVSLYVNGFNHRAVHVYEKVGFTQVGAFATVLF